MVSGFNLPKHVPHFYKRTDILMEKLTTVGTLLHFFFKVSLMNRYTGDPGINVFAGLDFPGPCLAKNLCQALLQSPGKKQASQDWYWRSPWRVRQQKLTEERTSKLAFRVVSLGSKTELNDSEDGESIKLANVLLNLSWAARGIVKTIRSG